MIHLAPVNRRLSYYPRELHWVIRSAPTMDIHFSSSQSSAFMRYFPSLHCSVAVSSWGGKFAYKDNGCTCYFFLDWHHRKNLFTPEWNASNYKLARSSSFLTRQSSQNRMADIVKGKKLIGSAITLLYFIGYMLDLCYGWLLLVSWF